MKRSWILSTIFLLITIIVLNRYEVTSASPRNDKPVEITYWQYWTNYEEKAIQQLVNKFNKTHPKIRVKMLTISEPRKKILLSIIGGTPPDVISGAAEWVPEFAKRNAIIPLDKYCKESMITKELFIPVFWEMLDLYGHIWALPTTPTATAIYWNKNMFKKAGLNPEKPPRTLKELEEYSEKLTKIRSNERILQSGFLPSWPPFAFGFYPIIFGGNWGNSQTGEVTANKKENIEGWNWVQSFAKRLGAKNIQTFHEECGNYQGPNNPFYAGKIAIEVNGVWEGNFISHFAPKIKWGVAPAPTKDGKPATIVNCDCIIIPRGSKHPKEAFEFISFLIKAENLEELCLLQRKFSPLVYSDREEFIKKHPNPYIKVFIGLAKSKGATYFPQLTSYELYKRELKRAFEDVMRLEKTPEEVLNQVQKRMERENMLRKNVKFYLYSLLQTLYNHNKYHLQKFHNNNNYLVNVSKSPYNHYD